MYCTKWYSTFLVQLSNKYEFIATDCTSLYQYKQKAKATREKAKYADTVLVTVTKSLSNLCRMIFFEPMMVRAKMKRDDSRPHAAAAQRQPRHDACQVRAGGTETSIKARSLVCLAGTFRGDPGGLRTRPKGNAPSMKRSIQHLVLDLRIKKKVRVALLRDRSVRRWTGLLDGPLLVTLHCRTGRSILVHLCRAEVKPSKQLLNISFPNYEFCRIL